MRAVTLHGPLFTTSTHIVAMLPVVLFTVPLLVEQPGLTGAWLPRLADCHSTTAEGLLRMDELWKTRP